MPNFDLYNPVKFKEEISEIFGSIFRTRPSI